jgi:hypothetical protein
MLAKTNPRAGGTGAVEHKAWECGRFTGSSPRYQQTPIRAELIGSDQCSAEGFNARGAAPVLVLCRELIAAGLNPDQALQVYRGATLALRVRSIGEAANLEINSKSTGFITHRAVRAASRARKSGLNRHGVADRGVQRGSAP